MRGSQELRDSSLTPLDVARFWSKVKVTRSGCWLWLGRTNSKGYGVFDIGRTSVLAHRVAFALGNGVARGDLSVCHDCDTPPCCRFDHLFEGTNVENVADSMSKGRSRGPAKGRDVVPPGSRKRGSEHGRATLTEGLVLRIRAEASSGVTRKALEARYGLPKSTLGYLLRRKTWRHI